MEVLVFFGKRKEKEKRMRELLMRWVIRMIDVNIKVLLVRVRSQILA